MEILKDKDFREFLKNKICKGCINHCLILEPNCNRSRIFIKDEYEKFLEEKNMEIQGF